MKHPQDNPRQALNNGIVGEYWRIDKNGELAPTKALITIAVKNLDITPPKGNPFWRYLLAYASSATVGYIFWGPFLLNWLEEVKINHYALGAVISMIVLLILSKLFEFVVAAGFENWRQRVWSHFAIAIIIVVVVSEFTAVAIGLSGFHNYALEPVMRYMPYLAGLLLTAINVGKAAYLARNHIRHVVIHQMTDQLLHKEPYKQEAAELIKSYSSLEEQLIKDRTTLGTSISTRHEHGKDHEHDKEQLN